MSRKSSTLLAGGLVLAFGLTTSQIGRAAGPPNGGPFQELWAAVEELEARIDALEAVVAPCQTNADCAADEFCHHEIGVCDAPGTCLPRPDGCPALFQPVCSCDFETHVNPCFAALAGASIVTMDACP